MGLFNRKPTKSEIVAEQPREDTGKFASKSGTKVREVSQLASAVREILEVSREIQALGTESNQNNDDVFLQKGLEIFAEIVKNKQQPVQQIEVDGKLQAETNLPPELANEFKKRYGKKLLVLKKAVSRDEFEMIVKLVKTFKSTDIINLIYGEGD